MKRMTKRAKVSPLVAYAHGGGSHLTPNRFLCYVYMLLAITKTSSESAWLGR